MQTHEMELPFGKIKMVKLPHSHGVKLYVTSAMIGNSPVTVGIAVTEDVRQWLRGALEATEAIMESD